MADRPATMGDVARLAEVSLKTVSRVVNEEPNVSEELRHRVLAAIEELGFKPNRAGRSLVTGRSGIIGVVAYGSPLYGPSMSLLGLVSAIKRRRLIPSIVTTEANDVDEVLGAVDSLIRQGVDGVLVAEPVADVDLASANFGTTPVMNVGGSHTDPAVPIGREIEAGVKLAVEHLLGLGHETVHHLGGSPGWFATTARTQAWEKALIEAGREVPPIVYGDWTPASGYEAGRALAADLPTAILVANDHMAIGLMKACQELSLSVPEDISIVGFDDIPEAAYLAVPLTSVRVDVQRNMAGAVDALLRRIEGVGGELQSVAPTHAELIVRASTMPPK